MNNKTSKQQKALNAANTLDEVLFDVEILREVVQRLREDHQNGDETDTQISVIDSIIDEKLHTAFHATEFVIEQLTPKQKTKAAKSKASPILLNQKAAA